MRVNLEIPRTVSGVILIALIASSAWGHGVDMFARVEGRSIVGTLKFADGTPVANAPIRAFAPDGTQIEEVTSNAEGHFQMPLRYHERYRLVGEAGPGHRGLCTVPREETPDHLPVVGEIPEPQVSTPAAVPDAVPDITGVDPAVIEAVVAREIGILRDELHAHDTRIRLRDVLGGIGYLFGLMGLYVMVKKRSKGAGAS